MQIIMSPPYLWGWPQGTFRNSTWNIYNTMKSFQQKVGHPGVYFPCFHIQFVMLHLQWLLLSPILSTIPHGFFLYVKKIHQEYGHPSMYFPCFHILFIMSPQYKWRWPIYSTFLHWFFFYVLKNFTNRMEILLLIFYISTCNSSSDLFTWEIDLRVLSTILYGIFPIQWKI